MSVKIETIYPYSGGELFYVSYDSPQVMNKDIAKAHKKRLEKFLKEEKILMKKQEKKFKEMIS